MKGYLTREHVRDVIIFVLSVLVIWGYLRLPPFDDQDIVNNYYDYSYTIVQEDEPAQEETKIQGQLTLDDPVPQYTNEEIDLIALCTMAEAEGEPELGQRLVIDTILNRVEHPDFADTVREIVYAPNQFTSMTNGRADRCYVKESIRALVVEEIRDRTDKSVLYFRAGRFHDFGIQLYKIGNHYFSTK